ncbi:NmrA family transcriptional regulator [Tersicoccus solisilvae]|uniref:NmrA family transcriptional regulator n=1 Tax=Tersicoccus solisilvae TaxID=1882339 RepID=A0ABQ1PH29_9MICC|nr:NAD(P)H-binding protein [Tersicoccus solisilvae]GGC96698.1 NmrA family transcriptional regulator [Tersicoccus solisilvae]
MTIGVMAPRGNVGRHVLRLLVQSGERPRALLRDPAKLARDVAAHVDAVAIDVGDADAVLAATRGLRAVYWVSPTAEDRDPAEAHAQAGRHLGDAVRANGIARVVFQSSIGAEKRHGVGEIDGLAATEVTLDESGASTTHLRCGYFFTNLLMDLDSIRAGVLATAVDLDKPMPWVDPADIAAVAVGRLLSETWTDRHVQAVHGPEDLSFRQVAVILTEVLGRPVEARQLSDADLRAAVTAAGLPDAVVESIVAMTAGLRELVPEDPRSFITTTPSSLTGWIRAHLAPVV